MSKGLMARNRIIPVPVTIEEKERIVFLARANRRSTADYMRTCALKGPNDSSIWDKESIAILRRKLLDEKSLEIIKSKLGL